MKDHLLFFESRNQQRSLKGTICAMMRSPFTFDQVKPGSLSNTCCLGLVEKGALEWLFIGWNAGVIKDNFGNHWRKKKTTNDSINDMDGNKEGGDSLTDGPVDVLLPDDEDFDHDRGQSRMMSTTENDHLRGVGGDIVSESKLTNYSST